MTPREEDIPSVGLIRVKDAETGKTIWLDTSNKAQMKRYKLNYLKNQNQCQQIFFQKRSRFNQHPYKSPIRKISNEFFQKNEVTKFMIIKHFLAVLLLCWLSLISLPSMGQNSTEAPSGIGPASSLKIDTTPIGTKADNEQKF